MIICDDRIGAAEYAPPLRRLGLDVEVLRLESADFAFTGDGPDGTLMVGIEMKRTRDLLNSIRTGRLSGSQLVRLTAEYQRIYILWCGYVRPSPDAGVLEELRRRDGKLVWVPLMIGRSTFTYAEIDNYLTSMQECGLRVKRANTTSEAVWTIHNLYRRWQRPWKSHKAHEAIHVPATLVGELPFEVRVATQLDGIGIDRAKAIAARFPSVSAMCRAHPADFEAADGIGPKLSRSIIAQLHGDSRD